METPIFTPRPSPWLLLAIAVMLLGAVVFGLDHGKVRTGGLFGVAGAFLALLGVWLATRKRRAR